MKTKTTARPVRTQKERAALTREKILASAYKIFVRDGFEASKLEEIAAAAGYTRGAFYKRFKNKEELFVEVAGQQIEEHISKVLDGVHSGTDAKSKIQIFLQQFNESMVAGQNLGVLMLEFSLFVFRHPRMKKHLTSLNDQINDGIRKTFEEIYANTDLKNISLPTIGIGFYSLAQGLTLQKIMNGSLITTQTSSDLLQLYLNAALSNS